MQKAVGDLPVTAVSRAQLLTHRKVTWRNKKIKEDEIFMAKMISLSTFNWLCNRRFIF
jgi:hypothetical protein